MRAAAASTGARVTHTQLQRLNLRQGRVMQSAGVNYVTYMQISDSDAKYYREIIKKSASYRQIKLI